MIGVTRHSYVYRESRMNLQETRIAAAELKYRQLKKSAGGKTFLLIQCPPAGQHTSPAGLFLQDLHDLPEDFSYWLMDRKGGISIG